MSRGPSPLGGSAQGQGVTTLLELCVRHTFVEREARFYG